MNIDFDVKLQRKFDENKIPYELKFIGNNNQLVVKREKKIITEENQYYNGIETSEILFEALTLRAKLLWLDVTLIPSYKYDEDIEEVSNITEQDLENTAAFMCDDSFYAWRYQYFPGTEQEVQRFNIKYLVLYLVNGSNEAEYLKAYFKTEKKGNNNHVVYIPVNLINTLIFEEYY